MRLVLDTQAASWLKTELAYEQRARTVSEGAGSAGGAGILLSEGEAPYRIQQVDDALVEIGTTHSYGHELDRASAAIRVGGTEITVGRQAVGWGRGVLFSAVDIFAPFSALEADREWRRGIDAIRADIPLSDLVSLDLVAAVGESRESSAFVGRLRGYVGNLDGEIIFGRRYDDGLYAATVSSPLGDAEIHCEIALFNTPEDFGDGGAFGKSDLVAKSVVGSSYSLDLGAGLYLVGEYHFSGFGVRDVGDAGERLEDAIFEERLARGDTQILGRHAGVIQTSYGFGSTAPVGFSWIFSPVDGSGVLTSGVTWVFSDNVTLLGNVYIPYGEEPENGEIRSEYGGTPAGGLVQISFYY